MAISPTAEGFRAALRRPSFAFAEITWRWVVGATAASLLFYGFIEYLRTLPVTSSELLLLRSRQPYLVSQALSHILRGSLGRVVASALIAALMLSILWMIAASVGRMATVSAMLEYFREKFAEVRLAQLSAGNLQDSMEAGSSPVRVLMRLNFLRIAVALAAMLGFLGAAILVSFASSDAHPRPGLTFFLFLPLAAVIGLAWLSLNWLLSLAAMFAVRDNDDAIEAINAAVTFIRERLGAVFAVSTWTGVGHAAAFMGAFTVVSVPISFAPILPGRLLLATMIVVMLVYFALVDWLYTARLAGYLCIAELPESMLQPAPSPQQLPAPAMSTLTGSGAPPAALATSIDREELILSDAVAPARQTSIDRDELILSDHPPEPGFTKSPSDS